VRPENTKHTGSGERVSSLSEDLHKVVSQIAAGQIQTENGVGQSVTLQFVYIDAAINF